MSTFCKIFVNTSFNLITQPAVLVFTIACHFMFLVHVAERRKKVSSRGVYRNGDAVIVGSNPAVINHPFFCEERKTPPNQDTVKLSQPEVQLTVRG